jgi:CubicO group peptidase (beta-lactamase class C family)
LLSRRSRGAAGLALALTLAAPTQAAEPTPYQRALAAGYKAAFLCSGIFNAGRTQAQVEALELTGIYPEYQPLVSTLQAEVVPDRRLVRVSSGPELPARIATWYPGLGCRTWPIGTDGTIPIAVRRDRPPPKPDPRSWPLGDADVAPPPSAALRALAERGFDGASYGNGNRSTGLVIVQDGRVTAERYADGFGPLVSNRTWSVAKSITGTLVGVAVERGLISPDRPAPIAEWRYPGDPRARITIDQLLRMASGLHSDTAGNRTDALYMGATTVNQEAIHWPLEAAPGSRFRYANNDTLLAVLSLRAVLRTDSNYAAFPGGALFSRIGMGQTVAETDWQGNFILSSQVWSTARDLARLGLLWLNDGVWQGERILPEGWMTYMTTPSGPQPAEGPGYGATLWLFGPKQGLPEGSYAAQGNRGQFVMVVPSHKLVIVRRGEDPHGVRFDIAKFTADVIAALE